MPKPSDREPPAGGGAPAEPSGAAPESGDEDEVLVFTRRAVREVDRLAVEEFGIPSIVLMENAAIHLADVAVHLLQESDQQTALIVCGPGNNGGDGLALARHLHNAGVRVRIVLAAPREQYRGDAAVNLNIAERMGLPIEVADGPAAVEALRASVDGPGRPELVVDALLGTGLDREVREPVSALIGLVNGLHRAGSMVLSVDIPSGLDADRGEPLGAAVEADVTVSFVGLKVGFSNLTAQHYLGEVVIADIGAPRELAERLGEPFREVVHPDRPPDHRSGDDEERRGGQRAAAER